MSRHRILTTVASATLALGVLISPAPAQALLKQSTNLEDGVLTAGTTGDIRVVFSSKEAAGLGEDGRFPTHALRVFRSDPGSTLAESIRRWRSIPGVVSARPEVLAKRYTDPVGDTYWPLQWDLQSPTVYPGSANAAPAWGLTTGDPSITVAVIDTGIVAHPDLVGSIGDGVDMIYSAVTARDGNSRDSDPTDVGDWCNNPIETSDWHGTHVAGTIAAQHNAIGVRGIAPAITVLPIRALGACGAGSLWDIIDSMRWASGLLTDIDGYSWSASGISSNLTPARVINLSLGVPYECAKYSELLAAVHAVTEAGSIIVAAAGNEKTDAKKTFPGGCPEVVSVAAVGPTGSLASYSNYGTVVDIAAPGGDRAGAILSTVGAGKTTLTGYTYDIYAGTSMAAPHVAGALALLLSQRPEISNDVAIRYLSDSARPIPTGQKCKGCGAGLLDVGDLVNLVPQLSLSINPATTVGLKTTTAVEISGGSSSGGVTLSSNTPSICTTSGISVTGQKTGICTLVAKKARDTNYFSVTSEPFSVQVLTPPKATRAPAVTLAFNKLTVSVTDGTWSVAGTPSYAWYRCTSASNTSRCTLIGGQTTSSYTVNRPTDIGYFIRAQVTMTSNGISVPAWSNATAKIVAL